MTNNEFIDVDKLFIQNINEIVVIDIIKVDEDTRIENLMYRFYGNDTGTEDGIDGVVKFLPLILFFNGLSSLIDLKPGIYFKIPDIESLVQNIVTLELFEDEDFLNTPGVYSFRNNSEPNKSKTLDISKSSSKSTTAIPKLNVKLPKITADFDTGIITF